MIQNRVGIPILKKYGTYNSLTESFGSERVELLQNGVNLEECKPRTYSVLVIKEKIIKELEFSSCTAFTLGKMKSVYIRKLTFSIFVYLPVCVNTVKGSVLRVIGRDRRTCFYYYTITSILGVIRLYKSLISISSIFSTYDLGFGQYKHQIQRETSLSNLLYAMTPS